MLVSNLLSMSLRKIGALSSGETIETTRQAEALSALQTMLRAWGALGVNVYATVKDTFTLSSGTASYSWGSGGTFNSVRPTLIAGAYILDSSNVSHPVEIITEGQYRAISTKTISGRPYALFYHALYPLGYVYPYPVPDAAESLCIDSYKPFVETGSFGLTTDTLVFPEYYEEPIVYNLAIRLAPEYGKSVPAEVAAVAKTSYDNLIIANSVRRVEPVSIIVPGGDLYGAGYSINSDAYR